MTMAEARERGWDEIDVVIVTGDAYIDHPSFAMSILGRTLEAAGVPSRDYFAARLALVRRLETIWSATSCFSASVPATWTR